MSCSTKGCPFCKAVPFTELKKGDWFVLPGDRLLLRTVGNDFPVAVTVSRGQPSGSLWTMAGLADRLVKRVRVEYTIHD